MDRLSFAVPEGQRFSCRQCGDCCRWWRIEVEPAERDRLLAHDWGGESPRLRGVRLFEEQKLPGRPDPVIQTAQVDGHCVFLEPDNLCTIHRALGLEAKPIICQAFPLMLIHTPDGPLAAGNYACTALVRNEGEPFSQQETFALELLRRAETVSQEGRPSAESVGQVPAEPILFGSTRMAWTAYRLLEGSLLEVLEDRRHPVTRRAIAAVALVSSAVARWAGRSRVEESEASAWQEEMRREGYSRALARGASPARVPPMRQRAVLAPLIADVETAEMKGSSRTATAMGCAVAVVNGVGRISLPTLRGQMDLAAARQVAFDQDSAAFDDYLSRFLCNFVMRKSLLESPTLREGARYLALYFALARWYSVAAATMAGHASVVETDAVEGIKVVEKAYVHRMGLRSGFRKGLLSTLLRFEMDFLVPPAALVRSYQPRTPGTG